MMNDPHNHRRDFLRMGLTVASGIVLPASFTACSNEGDRKATSSIQTFVQPTMLDAQNGVLDITLTASYWDTKLS